MKNNLLLFVILVEFISSDMFKNKFFVISLEMRCLLECVTNLDVTAVRSIYKIMKKNTNSHTRPLEKSMLARNRDPALKEIGTEKVRQILHASLFFKTYEHKHRLVPQLFIKHFRQGHCLVNFVSRGQCVQFKMKSATRRPTSI